MRVSDFTPPPQMQGRGREREPKNNNKRENYDCCDGMRRGGVRVKGAAYPYPTNTLVRSSSPPPTTDYV